MRLQPTRPLSSETRYQSRSIIQVDLWVRLRMAFRDAHSRPLDSDGPGARRDDQRSCPVGPISRASRWSSRIHVSA